MVFQLFYRYVNDVDDTDHEDSRNNRIRMVGARLIVPASTIDGALHLNKAWSNVEAWVR
jgi:hypothetical protein